MVGKKVPEGFWDGAHWGGLGGPTGLRVWSVVLGRLLSFLLRRVVGGRDFLRSMFRTRESGFHRAEV